MTRHQHEPKFDAGIGLLGAVLGAATVYALLETDKGEKVRKRAYEVTDKVRQKTRAVKRFATSDLGKASEEIYTEMKDFLRENKGDITNLDREDAEDIADRMRECWYDLREEIEEILENKS